MATQKKGQGPWRARVKDQYIEQWLGSYPTKEEAEAVEEAYRQVLREESV